MSSFEKFADKNFNTCKMEGCVHEMPVYVLYNSSRYIV